jgi:D-alanine transaminase
MPAGRIAYVDGRYERHGDAAVHIEDRGLQFADAVYEVFMVMGGLVFDESAHLDRLERSLGELSIAMPIHRSALRIVLREMVRLNRIENGFVYLQVTRGVAKRDHFIPKHARPSLILTARPFNAEAVEKRRGNGVAVFSTPDIRWGRCDIKSTALLPNVLAKSASQAKGGYEVWFVDEEGFVTEGGSTNAWIVTRDGVAVTRALGNDILPGVTRAAVLQALKGEGLAFEERSFRVEDALQAREAFVTSATGGAMPVVTIDGKTIGNGHPGSLAARIQDAYMRLATREAELNASTTQRT